MTRFPTMVVAAFAVLTSSASLACGACDEDKIAATYDHAVIKSATVRHRAVVFVAIEGPVGTEKIPAQIAAAARRIRGIQAGTLRTSLSPPAFSFVLDGTRVPDAVIAEFRNAVARPPLRLTLIRVMRNG